MFELGRLYVEIDTLIATSNVTWVIDWHWSIDRGTFPCLGCLIPGIFLSKVARRLGNVTWQQTEKLQVLLWNADIGINVSLKGLSVENCLPYLW